MEMVYHTDNSKTPHLFLSVCLAGVYSVLWYILIYFIIHLNASILKILCIKLYCISILSLGFH